MDILARTYYQTADNLDKMIFIKNKSINQLTTLILQKR